MFNSRFLKGFCCNDTKIQKLSIINRPEETVLGAETCRAENVSAYRTVSTSAVLVLASVPPINLLAEKRQETFQLRKELTCADLQKIARAKEAIRKDGRRRVVEKWQMRWHGEKTGRWIYRLILQLATWLNRKHGKVGFYLAQALSGHGCFNVYLRRFKKRDEEMCCYCDFSVDAAEHALFVCAKWGGTREVLGQTREPNARRERNNVEGQQKSHRGLHPRSCVSGGFDCPRRSGQDSFQSSPGWCGLSVRLARVWPRTKVPGERMTEESYATLSRNQPPVKVKAERRFRGRCIGSREGFFFVLTGMLRPILGMSCTRSITDFTIFPPHPKKKNYNTFYPNVFKTYCFGS